MAGYPEEHLASELVISMVDNSSYAVLAGEDMPLMMRQEMESSMNRLAGPIHEHILSWLYGVEGVELPFELNLGNPPVNGYILASNTDGTRYWVPNTPGGVVLEADPIFSASPAAGITLTMISNWDTAYGWGDHAGLYSLIDHTHTGMVDTLGTPVDNQVAIFTDSDTIEGSTGLTYEYTSLGVGTLTARIANVIFGDALFSQAYINGASGYSGYTQGVTLTVSGGNGYPPNGQGAALCLYGGTSYGERFAGHVFIAGGIAASGYGGNVYILGGDGVIDGFVYFGNGSSGSLPAKGSETNVVYYDTATGRISYGGATGGMVYPAGSGIPIVVSGSSWGTTITDNSANWNTAYGWGDHTGLYRPIAWVPTWDDVTNKPTTFTPINHGLVSSYHTVSGLTTGHFLRASGSTTFAFSALVDTDVKTLLSDWFTLEGTSPDQYIRCKYPFACDYDIQAYTDFDQFPPTIWESMPLATTTDIGGVLLPGGTTTYLRGDGTWATTPSSMVYPTGSGIPIVVSGTSWGTTITASTGYLRYNGSAYVWLNETYSLSTHAHGNITNAGYLGSTASIPLITGTAGIIQAGSFGSSAGTFCQGNDSRLSDARTPVAHDLTSSYHTDSGLTTGHFLKATGSTTFDWAAHGLTYTDVGAAASSHAHGSIASGGTISVAAVTPADTDYIVITDTSASGLVSRGILIGTSTTTFLRNDGTWATPATGTNYWQRVTTTLSPATAGDSLQIDGNTWLNGPVYITGDYLDTPLGYLASTNNCNKVGLDNDKLNMTVITNANRHKNPGIAASTHPTLSVWSNADPEINANQYIAITHNGTDGVIWAATGVVKIDDALTVTGAVTLSGLSSSTTSYVLYYNAGVITYGATPSGGGVTLSGSTDNTICTVTGANAIQGESNLTFNGSILGITGDITFATGTPRYVYVANAAASAVGNHLYVRAGNSVTAAYGAGSLYLKGGDCTGGGSNSGSVFVYGGTGGSVGNVSLAYDGTTAYGYVGIRTVASSSYALSVAGNVSITGTLTLSGIGSGTTANVLYYNAGVITYGAAPAGGTTPVDSTLLDWSTDRYQPYAAAAAGALDTSSTTPTGTTRMNYGGYFYATQLYEGSTRVSTTSHTHGSILAGGTITATAITPASGDYIVLTDTSASGLVSRGIAIGTSTTTFLRNDGTWATPAGSGLSGSGASPNVAIWSGASTLDDDPYNYFTYSNHVLGLGWKITFVNYDHPVITQAAASASASGYNFTVQAQACISSGFSGGKLILSGGDAVSGSTGGNVYIMGGLGTGTSGDVILARGWDSVNYGYVGIRAAASSSYALSVGGSVNVTGAELRMVQTNADTKITFYNNTTEWGSIGYDYSASMFKICYGAIENSNITLSSSGVGIGGPPEGFYALALTGSIYMNASSIVNLAASTTTIASMRIRHGVAPSSPGDGDVWTTTSGMYVRINGTTVGPLGTGGSGVTPVDSTLLDWVTDRYQPYAAAGAGRLYTGTGNPTNSDRLNYDGYLYATRLYSAGEQVVTLQSSGSSNRIAIWYDGDSISSLSSLYMVGDSLIAAYVETAAATTSYASLTIPHGTAPSAPVNGAIWTTSSGMYVRINSTTIGPLGTGGGGIDGSGASTRIAYWVDTDTLTSSANLTFDGSILTIANGIKLTAPSTSGTASGIRSTFTAGEALAFGNMVYLKSDGKVWKAGASSTSTNPVMGMCLNTVSAEGSADILLAGRAYSTSWSLGVGSVIYLSTSGGGFTTSAPNTTGYTVQVLGVTLSSTSIYFNPSPNRIILA